MTDFQFHTFVMMPQDIVDIVQDATIFGPYASHCECLDLIQIGWPRRKLRFGTPTFMSCACSKP